MKCPRSCLDPAFKFLLSLWILGPLLNKRYSVHSECSNKRWVRYDDQCYIVFDVNVDKDTARGMCKKKGLRLAAFRDANATASFFSKDSLMKKLLRDTNRHTWIGAYDASGNFEFRWEDSGELITSAPWVVHARGVGNVCVLYTGYHMMMETVCSTRARAMCMIADLSEFAKVTYIVSLWPAQTRQTITIILNTNLTTALEVELCRHRNYTSTELSHAVFSNVEEALLNIFGGALSGSQEAVSFESLTLEGTDWFQVYVVVQDDDMVSVLTAYPTTSWGHLYYIFTLDHSGMFAVVTSEDTEVTITIHLSPEDTSIKFNNTRYASGDILQYATLGVHSLLVHLCKREDKVSLTNTKVTGNRPVGVIVGNCPRKSERTCEGSVANQAKMTHEGSIDMMPPDTLYGVEFISPGKIENNLDTYLVVLATVDNTLLTYSEPPANSVKKVIEEAGVFHENIKDASQPFLILSSNPVGVILIQKLSCTNEVRAGGSAFLQPSALFSNNYILLSMIGQLNHYIVLTFTTTDYKTIDVQNTIMSSRPHFQTVSGQKKMSVLVLSVRKGTSQVKGQGNFGCIMYGVYRGSLAVYSILPKDPPVTDAILPEDECIDIDATETGQTCPPRHIGKNCDTLCHCNNNQCDTDGSCKNGAQCSPAWFGPTCQYWDAASTAGTLNTLLNDGDDSTCVNSGSKREEIRLRQPVLFTWARVTFHRAAYAKIANMTLTTAVDGSSEHHECSALRVTEPTHNTFDVFCGWIAIVSALTIAWEGPGQICSININGGQNVNVDKKVTSCSSLMGPADVVRLFDGDLSFDSCFLLKDVLKLTPSGEERITGILISYASTGQHFAIHVVCWTSGDSKNCDAHFNQTSRSPFFIPLDRAPVSMLTLNVTSGIMLICEVQLHGECHSPKHGSNCDQKCADTCLDGRCKRDGTCYQCREETTNRLCERDNDDDDEDDDVDDDASCPKDSRCHCERDLCDENLKCLQGSRCIKPWFTESCQYYDLAASSIADSPALTDHEDSTCYDSKDMTVELSGAVAFTWARIKLDNKVEPSALTLSFHTPESAAGQRTACLTQRTVELSDNKWDTFCSNPLIVDKIFVSLNSDVSVCSIYINAGREFGQKSVIQVPGLPTNRMELTKLFELLNDGLSHHDRCLSLRQDYPKSLLVILKIERPIALVIVQAHKDHTENYIVQVKGLDPQGSALFTLSADSSTNSKAVYFTVLSKPTVSVLQLDVLEGQLEICEIQVFGDCPTPRYGPDCEGTCPMTCLGQSCTQDRTCHRCREGMEGRFCSEGHLECPSGFLGPKCQQMCHCTGGACDKNGECTGGAKCKPGWFGIACQYRDFALDAQVENPLLIDQDDATCFSPEKKSVRLLLNGPILFTWCRVVFHHTALVFLETLTFAKLVDGAKLVGDAELVDGAKLVDGPKLVDGDKQTVKCDSWRIAEITSTSFDIFCSRDYVILEVTLTWKGSGEMCSFYIDGGNTIGRSTIMNLPHLCVLKSLEAAQILMDGNTSDGSGIVFNSSINSLHVFLESNKYVTGIMVNTDPSRLSAYSFTVQCLDAKGLTVCDYASKGIKQKHFNIPVMKKNVTKIVLQVTDGSMEMNELEIYAACPPPYYGLYCEKRCKVSCVGGVCNHNGTCQLCRGRNVDQHCAEETILITKKPIVGLGTKCGVGTFGRNCNKCRCSNNACDKEGNCVRGSSCVGQWFAKACQYYDVAATAKVESSDLIDHKDNTCYMFAMKSMTVNLNNVIPFTWVRIVFKDAVWNIELSFNVVVEGIPNITACLQQRTIEIEANTYDIYCGQNVLFDQIVATWNGSDSVCSIYVNGGRNLAVNSMITLKEERLNTKRIKSFLALLNNEDFASTDCFRFSPGDFKTVLITLKNEYSIGHVRIYNNNEGEEIHQLNVYFYNTDGKEVFAYKSDMSSKQTRDIYLINSPTVTLLELEFVNGSVSICEIEVFGDCPPKSFDVDCEGICILTCHKDICNYDGTCYHCRGQMEGRFCLSGRVPLDVGDEDVKTEYIPTGHKVSRPPQPMWHYYLIFTTLVLLIAGAAYLARRNPEDRRRSITRHPQTEERIYHIDHASRLSYSDRRPPEVTEYDGE